MTTHEDDTRRLVAEVSAALENLATGVAQLGDTQSRYIKRTRRMLYWTVAGLVFDLFLTGVGGFLYMQVHRNSAQLRAVDNQVSTQALCPLYDVFLRSYNPSGPVAQANPGEYERGFAVIEQGARALGCRNTTRGHR